MSNINLDVSDMLMDPPQKGFRTHMVDTVPNPLVSPSEPALTALRRELATDRSVELIAKFVAGVNGNYRLEKVR
jgi:hypothetical protein